VKLSTYHATSPPLVDHDGDASVRMVLSTRSGEVRVVDNALWRLVEAGGVDTLPADVRRELEDIEILVADDEDELETVLGRSDQATADDDVLYLVIQPSAACQLGCGYCGQEHTADRLSAQNHAAFVTKARSKLATGSYRHLHIGWFGAEPLLGLEVMKRMTPDLMAAAAEAGCGYSAKIATNGLLLTPDVARTLQELAVSFVEITLDGTPAFHDQRRFRKGGAPSFDQIFRNLVAVARTDDVTIALSVRCNVDRSNAAGVRPLIDLLASLGLQERVTFYVAPVHSWGNDAQLGSFERAEFARLEVDWLARQMMLGFQPGLVPSLTPIVCLATMRDAELVDAHGNLFSCTEVSYVPSYGDPNRHQLGTLADGVTHPERRAELGGFNERIRRNEFACHDCRMLPVCGGACPKSWLEGEPPCPQAKFNIAERLTLAYVMDRMPDRADVPRMTLDDALAAVHDVEPAADGDDGHELTGTPVVLGRRRVRPPERVAG
jgi:uncharacterized protein